MRKSYIYIYVCVYIYFVYLYIYLNMRVHHRHPASPSAHIYIYIYKDLGIHMHMRMCMSNVLYIVTATYIQRLFHLRLRPCRSCSGCDYDHSLCMMVLGPHVCRQLCRCRACPHTSRTLTWHCKVPHLDMDGAIAPPLHCEKIQLRDFDKKKWECALC